VSYRIEFERRVKKVIVLHAYAYGSKAHADHDMTECTFRLSPEDGHVYSSWTSDSATMNATVTGTCGCGERIRAEAEWPGYSVGEFFQEITSDET
jgi:hypothetical protein